MARISGMILGLGLLVVLSSIASTASAWDSDDDDDHRPRYKQQYRHAPPPIVREPILIPPGYGELPDYQPGSLPNDPHNPYGIDYGTPGYPQVPNSPTDPQYQPHSEIPLAPPPLPPEALFGTESGPALTPEPLVVPPAPEVGITPEYRPGQSVDFAVPLYPHVRVSGRDEIPRHAVPQIVAVRSPDPFRFPGLVYVQVYVLPGRGKVKVEAGGAKIEMKYDDFEVKVVSARGIVSVEYDD